MIKKVALILLLSGSVAICHPGDESIKMTQQLSTKVLKAVINISKCKKETLKAAAALGFVKLMDSLGKGANVQNCTIL